MADTEKIAINIYTESNPNPNSLKFVANVYLVDDMSFDFPDAASARKMSPLALELFEKFDFVERVFIAANFVTVTKKEEIEWHEVTDTLRYFIKEFLESRKPIIEAREVNLNTSNEIKEEDSETVAKIKTILDDYVRPAVENDGGAIAFHSYDEGVVKVLLQGSCSGCPSSTVTLKSGIENLMKRMIPEVKEVVAEGV